MDNEQHTQQKHHYYYTTFATISEFVLAFSIHILATFKITAVAMLLGAATFLLYTAVTVVYLRYSLHAIKNLS